jgi:hypothetical protein
LPLGTRDDLVDGFGRCSLRFGGQPLLDTARTTYLTTGAVLSLTRAALAFGLWRTTPRTALGARDDQGI